MNKLGAYLARPDKTRADSARKEEFAEAFKWLSEAQAKSSLDAVASLGAMYMNGTVPNSRGPDAKKGAALFLEGAKKGNRNCMANYAQCLESGIGVKANQLEAVNWYVKAAQGGSRGAIEWCSQHHVNVPGIEPPSLTGPPPSLTQ